MSDYNKFNKGNKRKDMVGRNANFVLLEVEENEMVTFFCHSVCPLGSYLNANSNGACQVCPENTYGTATDTASCNSCPNGETTRGQTGQTDVSACGK